LTRTLSQIEKYRKGDAIIQVVDLEGRPCPGLDIWVEQESHDFVFGCVVPKLNTLPEPDRRRYLDRLAEVFNQQVPAEGTFRLDVPARIQLGSLRAELDRLAKDGKQLDVHVSGQSIGLADLDEREGAHRLADLYTLCFAHPAVRGIIWHGFRDGDPEAEDGGLLRHDLSPKPAFRMLQKLVGMIWHTRAAGRTGMQGRFQFWGLFGNYRAAVMASSHTQVASIPLHEGHDSAELFQITFNATATWLKPPSAPAANLPE